MNQLTKSVKKLSQVFDLIMGNNFTTPVEQVRAKYPCTRYMY
jgi:hypothetical protein